MSSTAQGHPGHAALVRLLGGRGLLTPEWRKVWEQVPRELFIPPKIWRQGPERCEPVIRDHDRLSLIYSDRPVVTQVDDGQEGGPGVATSSNSMPSMVAQMLHLLDVRDGDRVLEIGTATGYVAALLCERLGDERVLSIELAPELAEQARAHLRLAGYAPTLIVGDGGQGWPEAAPYDRLIATCALRHVPLDLMDQVRPGGVLVAPMAREFWSGAVVQLIVQDDGTASGHFRGGASYMPMRSHRLPAAVPVDQETPPRTAESSVDPRSLLTLGFALYGGARLPDVKLVHGETEGGVRVWLTDRAGSGAIADVGDPVWQYGPRDLWSEVEAAHAEYVDLGRPEPEAFGLTVSPQGERVWLVGPDQVIRPVSADTAEGG
ncbi:methyltransferase [Streptomyces abyssalis]|uniref:Protein-L-isoaspartate O-methyltransferase n=1 Tax=Streptomyces abyssalis TaxID=933944 RepID=A0A1E7JNC0_9ACTN|nr:methyltransferase domain-containing protein [Streptomyces abyssalis]OEU86848.1 methyltransferase [Streptomyces abyssalis]OEU89768.1 methyltransferase [Streptomyces abyssalis]